MVCACLVHAALSFGRSLINLSDSYSSYRCFLRKIPQPQIPPHLRPSHFDRFSDNANGSPDVLGNGDRSYRAGYQLLYDMGSRAGLDVRV